VPKIENFFGNILKKHRIFIVTSLPNHSGGKFLCSLLDEHPQLYTLPFSLHTFVPFTNFEDYTLEQHIDRVASSKEMGKIFELVNKQRFCEALRQIFNQYEFNLKNFALACFTAYYFEKKIVPKFNTFVFHTHDWVKTMVYKQHFWDCTVIAICRHPVNLYGGYCKKRKRAYLGKKQPLTVYTLTDFFNIFHDFSTDYHDPMGLVLIEELHAHPERSLRLLANYLEIQYHENMLQSTECGKKWVYVGGSGKVKGFSEQHRKVDIEFLGKNLEASIFKCTRYFQSFAGYEKNLTLSKKDLLRSFLYDKSFFFYYKDLLQTLTEYLTTEQSIRNKVLTIIKHFIRQSGYFPFLKLKELFLTTSYIARRDASSDFSHVHIINPLQSDSMDYLNR